MERKGPAWTLLPNLFDRDTNNVLHSQSRNRPGISFKLRTYFNTIFELCGRTVISRYWSVAVGVGKRFDLLLRSVYAPN